VGGSAQPLEQELLGSARALTDGEGAERARGLAFDEARTLRM
jgi:hypothetical protein